MTLFSSIEHTDTARKLARREHPSTSHEAAKAIAPHLQERVRFAVAAVKQHPGKTGLELDTMLPDMVRRDHRRVARRLKQAEELGLVRRGEARVCSVSGKPAAVWFPTETTR